MTVCIFRASFAPPQYQQPDDDPSVAATAILRVLEKYLRDTGGNYVFRVRNFIKLQICDCCILRVE